MSGYLSYLQRIRSEHPETLPGEDILNAVKYRFITAIEACVDVAMHIVASEGWGAPATNAEAIALMAAHGVLPRDLEPRIRAAVGFRNLLVHGYDVVDDDRVAAYMDDLGDLEQFVSHVSRWVTAQE